MGEVEINERKGARCHKTGGKISIHTSDISVPVQRFDLRRDLEIKNEVNQYQAVIHDFYLVLPERGFLGNLVIREVVEKGRFLVKNHFDLGLFGNICLIVEGEKTRTFRLDDIRLAHIHYPDNKLGERIPINLDYSMGGDEHIQMVRKLRELAPDLLDGYSKGEEYGNSPVLPGTRTTLTMLFDPLKERVERLAREYLQ